MDFFHAVNSSSVGIVQGKTGRGPSSTEETAERYCASSMASWSSSIVKCCACFRVVCSRLAGWLSLRIATVPKERRRSPKIKKIEALKNYWGKNEIEKKGHGRSADVLNKERKKGLAYSKELEVNWYFRGCIAVI
jgi:hypothetical protein